MAYIILNNENSLIGIAQNDTDLNCVPYTAHLKNNVGGKVVSISDNDFNALVDGTKLFDNYDGTNVTLVDPVVNWYASSQEDLQSQIDFIVKGLTEHRKYPSGCSLDTKTKAFVTYLKSLDLSTFTYPLNQTIYSYCRSQGQEPFNTLQAL